MCILIAILHSFIDILNNVEEMKCHWAIVRFGDLSSKFESVFTKESFSYSELSYADALANFPGFPFRLLSFLNVMTSRLAYYS